ncbi:MarR family winged helix-turn-helix transcriptional regulator [Sphingomonas psychrotolerans]|uniref:MarR family transcriptional regulator n=1 Tax=Sphingomonas psychrotolerans TaxID=1327635 RepID=A0A2K8MLN6_9SPHN|nr:MarR family transcriptional regulator [Sphingomonas psychrotolerans]ATY33486.1 MarR family transcriptional regulator [Sphingomonas psychrotolerans]
MSRKTISFGSLSPLVGFHLRRASGEFALDFRSAVEGTGMRQVLVGILAVVEANPGINQGAVGKMLGIKRANMVSLINELVERGALERTMTPRDRRSFSLELTVSGKALLAECMTRIAVHEKKLLAGLSDLEQQLLLNLLSRIESPAG